MPGASDSPSKPTMAHHLRGLVLLLWPLLLLLSPSSTSPLARQSLRRLGPRGPGGSPGHRPALAAPTSEPYSGGGQPGGTPGAGRAEGWGAAGGRPWAQGRELLHLKLERLLIQVAYRGEGKWKLRLREEESCNWGDKLGFPKHQFQQLPCVAFVGMWWYL